ncbi:transcription factor bHLH112-like isoform X2 [Phragmites australis]|uniref:transcription factor bHLH112-like isoform X2 n=1 Tax=Phragmites australis TaxID=29695 RepID=UPI002D7776B2|nr:transcription factor bHLH112-like isoform X2 [Phragmites australis]
MLQNRPLYTQIPLTLSFPFHPPAFCHTSSETTPPQGELGRSIHHSMADEWWSTTSHRSHGTSACSAAPLTVTDRTTCGWTSPTAGAESTSSITFQDPYRSATHRPVSDAASSLGDPHMDWTQAFLSGRSDTSFEAVLQDDMVRAQPTADETTMNNPLVRGTSDGFLLDQALLAPSPPYVTAPSQALFDATAAHNISMYGDSQSSASYEATASLQFSQMLKPSMPASTQMQGGGAQMQFFSDSYLPFGGPLPSQLLLQALKTKPSSRSSNANNNLMVKDAGSPATRKGVSESPAAAKRPRIEAPSPLPTFKVRKEKLGDRITALQQLVSPFGKTDTASVLHEAIQYIKFLHDQVASLSSPYLKNGIPLQQFQQKGHEDAKDNGDTKQDLRSRGLCLVPVASTYTVASETVPEFWHPTFGGTFR